ncbi:MAG: hypothetical protein U1E25_08545 [Methylocystis sp.]
MDGPTIYDDGDDPYRAIRVGEPNGADAAKWGLLLSRFMRIVALFLACAGLDAVAAHPRHRSLDI